MKKTMILAAAAAMFMFASCQKEEVIPVQDSQADELVFTATIVDQSTKTTVNTEASSADKGKVSWENDDEITIRAGEKTAVYEIETITKGVATFKKKSGDDLPASGVTYTATYGVDITAGQTYSSTVTDLPMTASSTTKSFAFSVTCGLLKLNLTALGTESDRTISKIEVTGTPTEGTETTYTLTCSAEAGESIGSAKDFYIALPAGSYTDMAFYNKSGYVCQKSAKSAMTIENNMIQPVTLTGIAFNLLPGKFSVAYGKQVRFSKGNLYWNGSAFHIESSQTAYPTSWDANHVGHLFWTKYAANSYAESYSDGTCATSDVPYFAESKGGLAVDGQSGLYALSSAEWTYLIKTRTNASNLYKYGVTVSTEGKNYTNCLIIAPDGYSGTALSEITDWSLSNINSLGLVCLPAAGRRSGSTLGSAGSSGRYWSATPIGSSKSYAYYLNFNGSNVRPSSNLSRGSGHSVRLVCSVSK